MNRYQDLEKKINITFKDAELLDTAFVHASYVNEHKDKKSQHNERLEFLGDAVLELVVTEFLYKNFPSKGEGVLTNWRAALVKGKHLAEIAESLELGVYLYLSRGEERSGGRKKKYILANTLEALIGAIYLDQGYKIAHEFIDNMILAKLSSILEKGLHIDAKSRFQEISQEMLGITPKYDVMRESGPDHDKKFIMGAYLNGELIAEGEGSSKQKAEQSAAEAALKAKNWEDIQLDVHQAQNND
ncbi:MAG TPA: ribonuclease III [Candidatus Gracilibacteria bacterium]|nr:ribonuclease III [Candidatus Gracilibacteria bacterium]